MIEKIAYTKIKGVFNLGSKDSINKASFALKLAKGLDLKNTKYKLGKYSEQENKIIRPLDMNMNLYKFKETFQEDLPSINETISYVINDYLI